MAFPRQIGEDAGVTTLNGAAVIGDKTSFAAASEEEGGVSSLVRVLVVDDDEDDYLIARDLLAEISGASFRVAWIPDPEAAIVALSEGRYDICLLDYRLGRFNGLEVLREAIARGVRCPIILLTGQEDGNVDREAVRVGASDYLVKGRINSVLLDRSIRYARRQKQTEEALREQTDFVSAVLDTAGALVLVLDRRGRIVRFNRQCEKTTGYSAGEVIGRVYWEFLLPPEDRDLAKADFADPGLKPTSFESEWVTRSGERRCIAFSNTALQGADGEVGYIVSTGIDVTERRAAETQLELAREREVEVGGSIQKTLLVRTPPADLPGLEFGARSVPSHKIGGDYFDFFLFGDSIVDVLVGDVMGKGVPAALLAAATKNHFQRCARRLGYAFTPYGRLPDPQEIVSAVHANLTKQLVDLNSFVTLAYARFDLRAQTVTFVDCGHPRPIRVASATGACESISGENVPLGMSEDEVYQQVTVPIYPDDVFFFYSDGLTEAPSADDPDDLFGEERLEMTISEAARQGQGPAEIAETAVRAVRDFTGENAERLPDDLTCVAIKVRQWDAPRSAAFDVLELPSDADRLEEARTFLANFFNQLENAPVDEDTADLLILAVNEALANVMEHAYAGRTDGRIQIEAEAFMGQQDSVVNELQFRLYDTGEPFRNRGNVPPPSFDGTRDDGFGLFIMEQCFDVIDHRRDDMGRNCTFMLRRLGGDTDEAGEGAAD